MSTIVYVAYDDEPIVLVEAPTPAECEARPIADTVADDLRQAAREIERCGWIRHAMTTDKGELCALGALASVAGVLHRLVTNGYSSRWDNAMSRYHAMAAAFGNYLQSHHLSESGQIPGWNDSTVGLTAHDVRVHLEKAAAEYEELA